MRLGMLTNLVKCVACYSCAIKCKQEHFLPPGIMYGRLLISETGIYPKITKQMYPVLCNHCEIGEVVLGTLMESRYTISRLQSSSDTIHPLDKE